MKSSDFKQLVEALKGLTNRQKTIINHMLDDGVDNSPIPEMEKHLGDAPECPHCHSSEINRHGKTGDSQRYKCKSCQKTFVATTGTPLHRLRNKELWNDYAQCMIEGRSIRKSAEIIGVNPKTAFRWRHRLLQVPDKEKADELVGIVEADETLVRKSNKGQRDLDRAPRKRGGRAPRRGRDRDSWTPVLVARDRGGRVFDEPMESMAYTNLKKVLVDRLSDDIVFCSDSMTSYARMCKTHEIKHVQLNDSEGERVVDEVFHIQNVNAYHARFKRWMRRFNGVATKYLRHYLGWFRYLDTHDDPKNLDFMKIQQQLIGT